MTKRGESRRRQRRSRHPSSLFADKPFRLLRSPLPPLEMLSEEEIEQIHQASVHILEEVGVEFLDDEALGIWEAAGADVNHATRLVRMERGLVLEAVAQAPSSFTLRARNPEHNVHIGADAIAFAPTGGPVYASDLDNGRRPGSLADLHNLIRLAHVCTLLHIVEDQMVEPMNVPAPIRHLERVHGQFRLTDKVIMGAATGREVAGDWVNVATIVFGGHDQIQREPVLAAIVNANSPLRYDANMIEGLITYARAGQPVVVTPFILAGATSPITIAAAIAQQNAEALAGVALTQLVNPGVPVIYGGFTTNTDMQSGSPAFGTPEAAHALLVGAQLARRYRLPYRGSGGLNTSKLPDAQAGYETQMSLWPAVLGHTNLVMHSAGWLEGGLVCSFEKFILDVEQLAMMHRFLDGLEINDETLALNSIAEVGPGGHHFGTAHTIARFRTEFYRPIVSDRQNYDAWQENGALDAGRRANRLWKALLAEYQPPALEPAVAEALEEYVERRKREIGA